MRKDVFEVHENSNILNQAALSYNQMVCFTSVYSIAPYHSVTLTAQMRKGLVFTCPLAPMSVHRKTIPAEFTENTGNGLPAPLQ